jgi:predicted MFS family arabinose efflux permease
METRKTLPGAWPVLLAFTLVSAVTQLLWLNFAPLITLVMKRYGVGEGQASLLILVFPLIYIFLSLHAGTLIDRHGFRRVVGYGALATAAFSAVRIYDQSFWVLLAGQIGIAIAQPYVTNGISKLVSEWFDESQGAIATGVGTIGLFVGMATALAWTPALVAQTSLRTAMIVFAVIAAAAACVFVLVAKDAPPAPSGEAGRAKTFRELSRTRDLVIVFVLAFLGLGFFNGLTTWLEVILKPNGIDAEGAGLVGGALIVGGIFGAAAIPALSDALRRRKPVLTACTCVAAALIVPLCTTARFSAVVALGAALGFFFLPAYALLLEMCSELAGRASAGYATGLLMLAGNAGGVVTIVTMDAVKGADGSYRPSVWLLLGLLIVAIALSLVVSETFQRKPD